MPEQPTCGKGLAERAALPAALSQLTAAMADILEFHERSIDTTDEHGRKERQAYEVLNAQFRTISHLLRSTADAMASYRTLPMAQHDIAVLASRQNAKIFAEFVDEERRTAELMRTSIERDEKILAQMQP